MFKFIIKSKLLFVFILILSLFLPHLVKSVSWYDNFGYRKLITIYNPNGTSLDNYQIRVTLHSGTGVDSGSDIYLHNKVLSNFNDIRFTRNDETTLLDYWIESISSDTAIVWVEVNTLVASGNTNVYLYYGNSAASSQSNAHTTFPFYDDFDEHGIDGWVGSEERVDHAQEVGNQHQLVNSSVSLSSPNSAQMQTYASCFSGPFSGVASLITASPALSASDYRVEFGVKLQITGFRFSTGGVQRSRVRINDVEKYYDEIGCSGSNCTADGNWSTQSFNLTNTAINTISLVGDAYDCIEGNTFYDNVKVRHYVSTEPSIVGISSETTIPHDNPNNQPSSHDPEAPSCPDIAPVAAPDFFQIDTTPTNATLYFTPLGDTNQYYISYSTDQNAEEYGALLDLGSDGVQSYTVDLLSPGKAYYFKVRGQRGCMPGPWSGIKQATTQSNKIVSQNNITPTPKEENTLGVSTDTQLTVTPTTTPPANTNQIEEKPLTDNIVTTFLNNLSNIFK